MPIYRKVKRKCQGRVTASGISAKPEIEFELNCKIEKGYAARVNDSQWVQPGTK
jgi:hypothetical protein